MNNFDFQNPVKIYFGEGQIASIAKEVKPGSKVLMTYGGGSIKRNGIYDQVMAALKECTVVEFGGIEANPDYDTLIKAIALGKAETWISLSLWAAALSSTEPSLSLPE